MIQAILLVYLLSDPLDAQQRILYVLSACPIGGRTFPSALYAVSPADVGVKKLREMAPKGDGVQFVRQNNNLRTLVIGTPAYKPVHFKVVDMDKPWAELNVDIAADGLVPTDAHFIGTATSQAGALSIKYIELSQPPERQRLRGFQLRPLANMSLSWDRLAEVALSGAAAWSETLVDIIPVFLFDDGHLTLRVGGQVVKTEVVLPVSERFPTGYELTAWVNNREMLALTGTSRTTTPSKTTAVRVLDKAAGRWREVAVPWDSALLRGFGPWLTLVLREIDSGRVKFISPNEMSVADAPVRVSPGKAERRQKPAETGATFDEFTLAGAYYYPGTLILYDCRTDKQYVIETKQGDSEILLVEEKIVYYRVNRSIWKATITERGLVETSLVAEDDVIPDVHWAFFGPPIPAEQK